MRHATKGRSCRGSIWEVVTQLSHFLAVTTSFTHRFGVFQVFWSKWCFQNCARHIKKQYAKDIFLNLNFYFKRSTKKHKCPSAHLNSPRVHTYTLTEKSSTRVDLEPSTRTQLKCFEKMGMLNYLTLIFYH